MKPTPGPWIYAPARPGTIFGEEVETADGGLVCRMSHHPNVREQAEANARLVAHTPALVEALSQLTEAVEFTPLGVRGLQALSKARDLLRNIEEIK